MNTTPEILTAEVVENDKLIQYAAKTDLEPRATETLVTAFAPVFKRASAALAAAQGVAESVKDATCVTEIRKSRECRLALRAVRIEGDKIHKAQKENALRYGKAVDGFRNILLADIEPVEQALDDAEKTAERAEAARKAALRATREAELNMLNQVCGFDLGEMPESQWTKYLEDAQLLHRAKLEAAAKAEADRLAKEQAEREELARIAAENARLKAEAEESKRQAEIKRKQMEAELAEAQRKADEERKRINAERAKERQEAEAKLAAEQRKADAEAAKLRAELAAKAKAEADAKAKAEAAERARIAAERKAASAPDRKKLESFAATMRLLRPPSFQNADLQNEVVHQLNAFTAWCEKRAENL